MHNAHKWERTHDNTTTQQHTQARTKKSCRHKQGGGHQSTTSKLSLKSLQHQEHGVSVAALHEGCKPPKKVIFILITAVSLRLIPLPSSNLCRRLILCRFSSWRIWMCSSMFTPGRGGTGTAENKKKGGRHSAPAQKGGGRMKQNRTDTHQWVMERHEQKATTLISSYNKRMSGHKSMETRNCKQVQQCMFVQRRAPEYNTWNRSVQTGGLIKVCNFRWNERLNDESGVMNREIRWNGPFPMHVT